MTSGHPVSSLVGLLAVVSLTTSAAAETGREWSILNFSDGKCHVAKEVSKLAKSPEAFHQALRRMGIIDEVKVTKDDDGNVEFVAIEFQKNGSPATSIWFPTAQNCERGRVALQDVGELPDENDLK